MLRRGLSSLAAAMMVFHVTADACTPIRYQMTGVSAEAFARELVEDARGIELMRVVSRRAVPQDQVDPLYVEHYSPVYVYRFESLSVLNGRSRGAFEVYGLDRHWLQQQIPAAHFSAHEPLGWLTESGYAALQQTAIPNPADIGSIACVAPATFDVGQEYLVFRDSAGGLLRTDLYWTSQWRLHRPVIEPIAGPNDPWLREVRAAIAQNPKPGATFWKLVFELIFGRRRGS